MPSKPRFDKKVLLVDDDHADRVLFARYIRLMGFDVITTASPQEAMAEIVSGNVGCLVTDQSMPVSGEELAAIARMARSDIGLIFLSGSVKPDQPLPPGSLFVQKDELGELEVALNKFMVQWRRDFSG